jgi:DNA-binding CsgD family transcriptional regulator
MDCEVLLGGFFERSPSLIGGISVLRSARVGEFDEQARQFMTLLFPHLRNAAAIHRRLGALTERADAAQQALQLLAGAVLLLDKRCRVIFANRAAHAMLSAQDGLTLRAGRLRFLDDVANSELDTRLAIVNDPEQRVRQPDALLVARRVGGPPLRMLAAPVVAGQFGAALAILIDCDGPRQIPALDRLQACFGLTLAEARLVAELHGGATLREAAATLHVTLNTVRSQLKSARHKMGARSQAALLKTVAAAGLLLTARS